MGLVRFPDFYTRLHAVSVTDTLGMALILLGLLVAKIVEVLFVINPSVQERTQELFLRCMSHPISEEHLPSALMNFYTGKTKNEALSGFIYLFRVFIFQYKDSFFEFFSTKEDPCILCQL